MNSCHHKLGNCDVYIKDSSSMAEIEDNSVNLIVTSPPYWTLKNYDNHNDQIGFGSTTYEEYITSLNKVWSECIRVLSPDGKLCINIMPIFLSGKNAKYGRRATKLVITEIENYLESTNEMYLFANYIWDKRKITRFSSFGSYPYPPNIFSTFPYEWIIVFSKKGKRLQVSKEIKEKSKITQDEWANWAINSIWEMQPAKASIENHPAPFPEELPKRLIKLYSFYDDVVLDPFLGSGTTAKVALDLGRKAIGYEINSSYLDIIYKKLNNIFQSAQNY